MTPLIDSHAHLTFPELDVEPLLERAKIAGLTHIINICTTPDELLAGIELKKKYPWISNVGCTTPHDVERDGEKCFEFFEKHADQMVAIGETGLDYYYEDLDRELQQHFLRRYLQLAKRKNLPVVIHCREAFADFFKILDEEFDGAGVLHCFTGNMEEAMQVIERGWYLSISGIVTFKKSEQLQEVARAVPLDQLLIETDTPYLAPTPYRGKQNEPSYLVETAKFVAQLRDISFEELAGCTAQNASSLFLNGRI
ncbi:MAG: putative metal-dependent hydrolase YcfH [Chlamydiales bacterium]|nr:putative metal-dependent hydrolase YcfH [Chlamydiales bacterium]MCH9635671.1 putative metal-dependent hydrolase YcfH [Chlamydiales bacterium]MCH9703558.1 TatD family hydrolase [Chlamydiota bacterium]